jgi:hypothetical protein
VQIFLDDGAIRFKFCDRIKQRQISFESANLGSCKAISISTHYDDQQSFAQLAISVPIDARGLLLTSLIIYLMLFTRTVSHTKSKGLPIDIPYYLSYVFYTCSATYKKHGAPD